MWNGSASEPAMRSATTIASASRLDVVAQHHELVAAEAGDGVARPHERAQALGRLDEQLVADLVAQAVVDDLEAVEVEEQHRAGQLAPFDAGQRPRQAIEEELAVGQSGHRVVGGLVGELQLGRLRSTA